MAAGCVLDGNAGRCPRSAGGVGRSRGGAMLRRCGADGDDGEISRWMRWTKWWRSEEHTSELQSLMRISYAVFCLKKKYITTVHKYTINYMVIDHSPITS